ncbi:flagellar hook-associated protein FlgK [Belnapia moabensis]|uniref:flagellar hook-associated protein FlgK n=1 Tax=Belnapia moabensis TaxID=365533 RepID=UPI000694D8C2|nr:flagellar hook-associated protein FlgK [Belnapia moabensis]
MTIQGALLNALSSLAAEQAQAQIIANNIANASTPGYVRRDLPRSENMAGREGNGVALGVTQRAGDSLLEIVARSANGDKAYGTRMTDILGALTRIAGQPSDPRSLSSMLGKFQAAMTSLSSTPADAVTQTQAISAASGLVDTFHILDRAVSDARINADLGVAQDVDAVNTALDELARVERDYARAAARGESTAEFEDRRATLIDSIAANVPVRVFGNGPGQLILRTDQGTTLLDTGTVHRLTFTHSALIPASGPSGGLSAVMVDGAVLRSTQTGSIAAGLQLRDKELPQYGDMLDQMAANLATGFQTADPIARVAAVDGSGAKLAGLFTRVGATNVGAPSFVVVNLADPATYNGFARTLALNPKVDPNQPGNEPRRIRDGANDDATPGNASDNSIILAALNAMDQNQAYGTSTGLPGQLTIANAAAQSLGRIQSDNSGWLVRADTRTRLATQAGQDLSNKTGVNVDEEMQRLLLVQQTYSASAQVIQAAAKMLDTLNTLNAR